MGERGRSKQESVITSLTPMIVMPVHVAVFKVNDKGVVRTLESKIFTVAKGAELDTSIKRDVKPYFQTAHSDVTASPDDLENHRHIQR